jgi:hypothetical protein
MSNLDAINKQLAAATEALAKVDADLAWQATGVAADIAGTIDPTPVSDLVSAGVSVRNGDMWGAALSTVSMVPYLGDAVAKPVKAVRATKAIAGLTEKATALRKTITDLTKAKKEAEAAAEITAKEAKIAKEAEAAKDAAAQQEKSAAKKQKDCEDCKAPGKASDKDLAPGSAERKADRWERYQKRGGPKEYDQWSKQYDVNMQNYKYGLQREADYRTAMNAKEGTVTTSLGNRQIDILKSEEKYAGQLKTGPVSLTKENILAIKKDKELVDQGWEVEHILEKGASRPYLDALDKRIYFTNSDHRFRLPNFDGKS